MASDKPLLISDDDNPEWTAADFARARPITDFPALAAAFPNRAKPRGRPKGSTTSEKSLVSLRIDKDVLERFRASGPGWQRRVNEVLRKAAGI
jgi:uncharacterized protein (DUF4415 family)